MEWLLLGLPFRQPEVELDMKYDGNCCDHVLHLCAKIENGKMPQMTRAIQSKSFFMKSLNQISLLWQELIDIEVKQLGVHQPLALIIGTMNRYE